MKNCMRVTWVVTICMIAASATPGQSFIDKVIFGEKNLGGPRLGVTYFPGNTEAVDQLRQEKMGRLMSQFGWHFEYQVVPDGGGPSFVIELIPLLGGVEYNTIVPSGTLAMGIRFPDGIEFGLGPNMIVTDKGLKSSLVLAVGKTFSYGGVHIPINIAYATTPAGSRISFVFGYAIVKSSSQ